MTSLHKLLCTLLLAAMGTGILPTHAGDELAVPEMDNELDAPPAPAGTAPATAPKPFPQDKLLEKATTLKMLPLPKGLLDAEFACLPGTVFDSTQQYSGALPIAKEKILSPLTGVFFTNPQIVFVLFKSSDKAPEADSVIIDTNGNGDLSDEKVLTRDPKKSGIPVKVNLNETMAEMAFYFPQKPTEVGKMETGPRLCPPTMPQGIVTIGGKPVRCALFSATPGKPYTLKSTIIFLDLNNDGEYNLTWDDPLAMEGFQLAPLMYAAKEFLQAAVSPDGTKLYLAPYTGPTANLSVTLPATANPLVKLYVLTLLPDGGEGSDILRVITDKMPVKTPLGRYALLDATLLGDGGRLLSFSYPDFTLKPEGMSFPANKIEMKASSRIGNNMLEVQQKTTGPGDVLYTLVGPAQADDPGPLVEVFINKPLGKPIMTGHMEYG